MQRWRLVLSGLLLTFNALWSGSAVHGQAQPTQPAAILSVLSTTDQSIILEFDAPMLQLSQRAHDGSPCLDLTLGNEGRWISQQADGLPLESLLVGAPAAAAIDIHILEQTDKTFDDVPPLCPLPTPTAPSVGLPDALSGEFASPPPPPEHEPLPLVSISQQGFIRYQPVAQVRIAPVQWNAATRQLTIVQHLRVQLSYPNTPGLTSVPVRIAAEPLFDTTLENTVANLSFARKWQVLPARPLNSLASLNLDPAQPAYNIEVTQPGIVQISGAALSAAGIPLASIDPRNLHLDHHGEEAAIQVIGQADGVFNPDDTVLFYADPLLTLFAEFDTYRLTWDDTPGLRMASLDVSQPIEPPPAPALLHTVNAHFESDNQYFNNYPSGDPADFWYWDYLFATMPSSLNLPFTIQHPSSDPQQIAQLTGLLRGYSATPRHHTKISINGHLISSLYWASQGTLAFTASVPQSLLLDGDNTLTFEAPLDGGITNDVFLVNWFEMRYQSSLQATDDQLTFTGEAGAWQYDLQNFTSPMVDVYNITDPRAPQMISGAVVQPDGTGGYTVSFSQNQPAAQRYWLQTSTQRTLAPAVIPLRSTPNLRAASNSADYLIITHDNFTPAAQRLADYRAQHGLRPMVVPVQAIYDQFSDGIPTPQAIQEFVRFAFRNWQLPAPLYVVLLGDGHLDYRNRLQRNETNFLPPYLANVDPWIGETAVDNRFVTVSGDDIFPDLYLGRIPARNLAEANAVIEKTIAYEGLPAEAWNQHTLFVADNAEENLDFPASNRAIASLLPDNYSVEYLDFSKPAYTTASFKAAISASLNAGRGLLVYSGHGNATYWAAEQFFTRSTINALMPTRMLPFVFSLTCMDGFFANPSTTTVDTSSIAESLLRPAERGAVAAFSTTGWGLVDGHELLAEGLFAAIFNQGIQQAGAAASYAKFYLAAHSAAHPELIDTYTLFGDPALQLKLVPPTPPAPPDLSVQIRLAQSAAQAGDWIDAAIDYTNQGSTTAQGVILQIALPPQLQDATIVSAPLLEPHAGLPYSFWLPSLNPGQGGRINLHARIDPAYHIQFFLTARITSASPDSNPVNNEARLLLGDIPDKRFWLPLLFH